jgi:cytidine deaminase
LKEHKKEIVLHEYGFEELTTHQQMLVGKLEEMLPNAYAPYSNFPVSAVVALESGEVISGTNQENAAYPSGLCAERVALFFTGANYPKGVIKTLAVSVGKEINSFPYPCGACLQVISEFQNKQSTPFQIILFHRFTRSALIANSIEQLLPFAFRKEHLGKN